MQYVNNHSTQGAQGANQAKSTSPYDVLKRKEGGSGDKFSALFNKLNSVFDSESSRSSSVRDVRERMKDLDKAQAARMAAKNDAEHLHQAQIEEQREEEERKKDRLAKERANAENLRFAREHANDLSLDAKMADAEKFEQDKTVQEEARQLSSLEILTASLSLDNLTTTAAAAQGAKASVSGSAQSGSTVTSGATTLNNLISGSNSASASSGSSSAAFEPRFAANDETSNQAQAASKMLHIAGSEGDIEHDLNNINRHNLSSFSEHQIDEKAELAQKLATMDNKELRAKLDHLARDSNVSKLSLQMQNPQTLAMQLKDEQAFANLPSSTNNLSSLTAPVTAQDKLLNQLDASSETTNVAITQSATASSLAASASRTEVKNELNLQAAQEQRHNERVQAQNSDKVSAIGKQHVSTETLMRQRNLQQMSHGSESIASSNVRNNGESAAAKLTSMSGSQSKMMEMSDELQKLTLSDKESQEALKNGVKANGHTVDSTSGSKAQDALLRLAQGRANASEASKMAVEKFMVSQNLVADKAITQKAAPEIAQALASLQSSSRAGGTTQYYTTYENSSLYRDMFSNQTLVSEESELGSDIASDRFNSDNLQGFAANSNLSADVGTKTTQAPTQQPVAQDFNFRGTDPSAYAGSIHERVMQMAARNLKHLAVDLAPAHLGKMKINIDLSARNDAVAISLAAENAQTREALEQALPRLRELLAQMEIETEASVYELKDEGGNGGKGQQGAFAGNSEQEGDEQEPQSSRFASSKRDQLNVSENDLSAGEQLLRGV